VCGYVNYNNLISHRGPDDIIFILDFTNYYINIAKLFADHSSEMVEAISKLLLENMVLEYTINKDLEGGMFVENMRESMIFDIGEHKTLTIVILDELLMVIDEYYEMLDEIYGEVYGKLSHATRVANTILPFRWDGNANLDIATTSAKLTMISNPDLIMST